MWIISLYNLPRLRISKLEWSNKRKQLHPKKRKEVDNILPKHRVCTWNNPIIKVFRTIIFIFIVIHTRFWPIYPPAFFQCLSNPGIYAGLRTTSFIESTRVTCSDSVSHNQVQVLSIPVVLLACWTHSVTVIGFGLLSF